MNLIITNNHILNIEENTKEASNQFNNFFINVGKKLAENSNYVPKIDLDLTNHKTCLYSFDEMFLKEIDAPEVRLVIKNFKDDTAAGYDRITVKILKNISELIITPLVFIYNLSIKNSFFPDNFKTAIIKPLIKGGDRRSMFHYRPISMLTNFSKIFEKIIKSRLISYLEKNKLLSKHQYGFRPGLSTENALYQVTQFLYHSLDSGLKTMAIFLDLAKAFDTIHHNILFQILPSFGINNRALLWFQS